MLKNVPACAETSAGRHLSRASRDYPALSPPAKGHKNKRFKLKSRGNLIIIV
jgi:hypothetical protein